MPTNKDSNHLMLITTEVRQYMVCYTTVLSGSHNVMSYQMYFLPMLSKKKNLQQQRVANGGASLKLAIKLPIKQILTKN